MVVSKSGNEIYQYDISDDSLIDYYPRRMISENILCPLCYGEVYQKTDTEFFCAECNFDYENTRVWNDKDRKFGECIYPSIPSLDKKTTSPDFYNKRISVSKKPSSKPRIIKQFNYKTGDKLEINRFSPGYHTGKRSKPVRNNIVSLESKIKSYNLSLLSYVYFPVFYSHFQYDFHILLDTSLDYSNKEDDTRQRKDKFSFSLYDRAVELQKESLIEINRLKGSRENHASRQRNKIRRSINSNYIGESKASTFFFTLTFNNDVPEEYASYEVSKFMQRLQYAEPGYYERYIWVKERQPVSKRIHYHFIFFDWKRRHIYDYYEFEGKVFETKYLIEIDMYGIKRRGKKEKDAREEFEKYLKIKLSDKVAKKYFNNGLQSIWNNGWVWIERIKGINNVGKYVSCYLGKSDDFKRNSRMFAISYKCSKPEIEFHSEWQNNPSGKVLNRFYSKEMFERHHRLYKSIEIMLC